MAFAYFIEHFPHSFYPLVNDGALAIMFCFGCLYLAAAGGGPLSLDALAVGQTGHVANVRQDPRLQFCPLAVEVKTPCRSIDRPNSGRRP